MRCCQKIACKSCVDEWFTKNKTCPYCRTPYSDPPYYHIPWIDCLSDILNVYSLSADQNTICAQHSKQFEYICQDCDKYICSGCLYEIVTGKSSEHKNHKIIPILDEFIELKQKILQQVPLIAKYLDQLKATSIQLKQNSKDLQQEKESIGLVMYDDFNRVLNGVKESFKNAEEAISNLTNDGMVAVSELDKLYKEAKIQQKQGTIASILEAAKKLSECRTKNEKFRKFENAIHIRNPLLPEFHSFEIKIEDFINLRKRFQILPQDEVRYIYSKKIPCYGNKWRAKIYPNGNGNGLNTHLSFFVELLSGPMELTPYEYRVDIIPCKPNVQPLSKQYSSDYVSTDSWGWNKAAALQIISSDDYIKDGTLTLVLSIRALARYQECADLKTLIDKKRAKIKSLKTKLSLYSALREGDEEDEEEE